MPNGDGTGRLGRGNDCNDTAKKDRAGQNNGYGQTGRGQGRRVGAQLNVTRNRQMRRGQNG